MRIATRVGAAGCNARSHPMTRVIAVLVGEGESNPALCHSSSGEFCVGRDPREVRFGLQRIVLTYVEESFHLFRLPCSCLRPDQAIDVKRVLQEHGAVVGDEEF
jgi:hypothetical protein